MAIILNEYSNLLEILSSFYKVKILKKHSMLILGLILGLIFGIIYYLLVFDKFEYYFSSLFVGFVISGIKIKKSKKENIKKNIFIYLIIIGILILLNIIGNNRLSYNLNNCKICYYLFIFTMSILSSLAFILPGISGAMVLFTFGFYDKILKSVKQIITNEISFQTLTDENIVFLFVFLMGFLVGILAFSKIIDKFIKKKKDVFSTVSNAFLIGAFILLASDIIININAFYEIIIFPILMFLGYIIGYKIKRRNE